MTTYAKYADMYKQRLARSQDARVRKQFDFNSFVLEYERPRSITLEINSTIDYNGINGHFSDSSLKQERHNRYDRE